MKMYNVLTTKVRIYWWAIFDNRASKPTARNRRSLCRVIYLSSPNTITLQRRTYNNRLKMHTRRRVVFCRLGLRNLKTLQPGCDCVWKNSCAALRNKITNDEMFPAFTELTDNDSPKQTECWCCLTNVKKINLLKRFEKMFAESTGWVVHTGVSVQMLNRKLLVNCIKIRYGRILNKSPLMKCQLFYDGMYHTNIKAD